MWNWVKHRVAGPRQHRRLDRIAQDCEPVGSALWLYDGTPPRISPGFRRLLGLDQAVAPGGFAATLMGCLTKPSAERFRAAFDALGADAIPFDESFDVSIRPLRVVRLIGRTVPEAIPMGLGLWAIDVTEEEARRLEEAQAARQSADQAARQQLMLDALATPVWARDANLRLVAANRAYGAASELPAAQAVAEARELTSLSRRPNGQSLAAEARDSGACRTREIHTVLGGDRRLLRLTEHPVATEASATGIALVGQAVDITDQDELRVRIDRLNKAQTDLMETLNTGIAIYGADRRLAFCNSAWLRLWSVDERWAASQPSFTEVLEVLREKRQLPEQVDFRRYRDTRLALFTKLVTGREEMLHRPDGTTLRMTITPHPMGGLIFLEEDVTDRLALESSFNTMIAVQRETLDHLAEAVAVFGADGRLQLWNAAYATIWALGADKLALRPHAREILEWTEHFFAGQPGWTVERDRFLAAVFDRQDQAGRLQRNDGRSLRYAFRPLPDGAVIMSYADVTDTERVENALRDRAAALVEADRLKQKFLANVSYQLRTPLNAIAGFAEMLGGEGGDGALSLRQKGWLESIRAATAQLSTLVDAVLDLSLIEAGYLELDRRPIDLQALFETVQDWVQAHHALDGVSLRCEIAPGLGRIEADPDRLREIVGHLISNAVRAARPTGTVTLTVERAVEDLILTVSDNGRGMPVEDIERLMQPFERGIARGDPQGAGLGLALVKSFVDLHGGRLMIDSAPGRGTRVCCRIPVRSTTPAPREAMIA